MRKLNVLFDWTFKWGSVPILVYGTMLLMSAMLQGQRQVPIPSDGQQITDANLDRRIDSLEHLQLDHRITVLETVDRDLKDSMWWAKIGNGGVGLLLIEKTLRLLLKKGIDSQ